MGRFLSAFAAAFCLHFAVLALYSHYTVIAIFLMIASIIPITIGTRAAGAKPALRDAIATFIIIGSLLRLILPYLSFGGGGGEYTSSARLPGKSGTPKDGNDSSGDHTGIILLPEVERQTTLIAPLPSMPSKLFKSEKSQPLTIPFYGAYWFFKPPDRKPPASSFLKHGSPIDMTFRAPDRRPLWMEAHQNLGKLIDLGCCSEIKIEIRNAEPSPSGIWIELVLINTRENPESSVSLGRVAVQSNADPDHPARETLSFLIPSQSSIDEFDEINVRFPRAPFRNFRSARIAIDRFVLIPRRGV
jgi:hypothetical protein